MIFKLFWAFFKVGMFSFGGGYAMLPFMQKEVIEVHNWLTPHDFLDILAIAQITPGPVSINTATFVGYQLKGVLGSIVATTAVVMPSFIIVLLISLFFEKFKKSKTVERIFKGLRPIILGLIASAAVDIGKGVFIDFKSVLIAILIFYLMAFRKVNTILIIVLSGVLGVLLY
ncbi:chromate transport protein ChrA [Gottschalkia acidurici 9a]|uniref:Chromate transport protein ChrA n=1 Tax=Gottschalkia acidurici (strain ATCC 7906 / DSM 604 / BCRC 14475 / CIP 104303 / KCTC 5404 / NCIMB 10678 / 9a) TaxID=1128398 RepID=K0AXY6_GOTA9|nr:chromate transporter [Gottschalkia acidurici]AFS77266.1 chromate transport protein ChrA [Gottschalkia acidurici 9a]